MAKFLILISAGILLATGISCSNQPNVKFVTSVTCYSGGNIFFSDVFDTSKTISSGNVIAYKRDDGSKIYLSGYCIKIVSEDK